MPKRIALAAIGVTRNGATVYPPVGTMQAGEPFDFTDAEIKQIEAHEKANDVVMLRTLRNEGSSESTPAAALDNHGQNGQGSVELNKNAASEPSAPAPAVFTVKNTGPELKAEASARGLDFSGLTTKAQLVELLDANPRQAEESPAEESDEDL